MVLKRKAPRSARRGAPKRRRMTRMRRVRGITSQPLVVLKRTFWQSNWTPNTTTTAGFYRYLGFTFNQLPNAAEYTALFDAYRICGVKVTMRPRYDGFSGENTTDTTPPGVTNQGATMVHVIVDPTATTGPAGTYTSTTLNSFLENGNVRSYQGNRPVSFYVRPMIDVNTDTTLGIRRRAPFLKTQTDAVSHFGAYVFLQDVNLTGSFGQSWDIFYTYYFMCKGFK